MEYVEGVTLARLVREQGPLSPDEAAPLLRQVADALAAAHAAGIVHRDVKPSNIMVDRDGRVKLADFGIARIATDPALTQTGLVTGSPAYLAPEVAAGQRGDEAVDVWSLGATPFHVLAGRPPYDLGDNMLGGLYRIVNEEPPRLPEAPAGWRRWSPAPWSRTPRSAGRCSRSATSSPTRTTRCRPPAPPAPRRPHRRRPPAAAAVPAAPSRRAAAPGRRRLARGLVGLAVVLALVLLAVRPDGSPTASPDRRRAPTASPTGTPSATSRPAPSPDGRQPRARPRPRDPRRRDEVLHPRLRGRALLRPGHRLDDAHPEVPAAERGPATPTATSGTASARARSSRSPRTRAPWWSATASASTTSAPVAGRPRWTSRSTTAATASTASAPQGFVPAG